MRIFIIGLAGYLLISSAALADVPPPGAPARDACQTPPRPVVATHLIPPYPTESQRLGEEGDVSLHVTIGGDGSVSNVDLKHSSGFEHLDTAARDYVKDHWRWEPPPSGCNTSQVDVDIRWRLNRAPGIPGLQDPTVIMNALAVLPMGEEDYPPAALAGRDRGMALVIAVLDDKGMVSEAGLLKSSGSPALDARSIELAKSRYHWTAATRDGKPTGSIQFLAMFWFPPGETVPNSDQLRSILQMMLPPRPPQPKN